MHNLVWFRSDLRIYDNPALSEAMKSKSVVAIYLLTEGQWDKHSISMAKRSLIINQLKSLADGLNQLNVPLLVINAETYSNSSDILTQYASLFGSSSVYFNHEYEYNEKHCEVDVESKLASINVKAHGYHDSCIIQPGKIRTQQGECYKVFTAFKRTFIDQYKFYARPILNRPSPQLSIDVCSDLSALQDIEVDSKYSTLWPAGEDEAHDRLNHFIENKVKRYDRHRDIPSIEGTSEISPYLAVGALTTTQCMQAALTLNNGRLDVGGDSISVWVNELIWREFYRHLLVEYPHLCKAKPFKANTDRLPWKHDKTLFKAWVDGQTGYPIVDAGMRQLAETGWMHNRLRMITAMFLTKHLFIDWRWGERYFMEQLVDGDFASNNGGWQWSASTGVDAAPYFRIFNPTRQSTRFDAEGEFIRRFVPELRGLDNKSIHQPNTQQAIEAGYALPIVNHAVAVAQTKLWFKQLTDPVVDLFDNQEINVA
jgi:deoxyribodipyrimidine photo-lyase